VANVLSVYNCHS